MDSIQAESVIEKVFINKTYDDKKCVFIDGEWGVGKTHIINNFFDEKEKYDLIYISIFGKESVKDIEKSLLLNLIPGINLYNNNKKIKAITKFFNHMSSRYLGINIDSYINSFSIEDIKCAEKDSKVKIICFDDLERKSNSIEIKELLGLIERTSKKFNVILVCNLNELEETSKDIFLKYKEKVIDYSINIDKADRNILHSILNDMHIKNTDIIIDVYLDNNVRFGRNINNLGYLEKNINNLRIFIKYAELIRDIEEYFDTYKVNEDIAKICKDIVYNHYFLDKDNIASISRFDKFKIYNVVKKIFNKESIEKDEFKDYFISNSEIRCDLKQLYISYRLNENEFFKIIEKVNDKIEKKDLNYFINKDNVISIFDYFIELKVIYKINNKNVINKEKVSKLIDICIELYDPSEYKCNKKIYSDNYDDFDVYGNRIECNKYTKRFIEIVNEKCDEKYNEFIDNKFKAAKNNKDYDEVLKISKFKKIQSLDFFEEIFDYYFNKQVLFYEDEIEKKLHLLINNTESDIIRNFFTERKYKENKFTKIKKYEKLDFELDMKMQMESEAEWSLNSIEYDELFQ